MDYKIMTAPCGLDCFNCPMYIAMENEKLRNIISKNMNIPYDKACCEGCRPQNGVIKVFNWTEPCAAYKCITEKGLDFCCDCDDFPCDNLHPYADKASEVPHNTKVFNLCLIKKLGLEKWAQEKAKSVKDTYFKGEFKL